MKTRPSEKKKKDPEKKIGDEKENETALLKLTSPLNYIHLLQLLRPIIFSNLNYKLCYLHLCHQYRLI